MTIRVGERLPDATFKVRRNDKVDLVTAAEYFANAKVVLFGVPGAFTPTCHRNHLPGYLENLATLQAHGVDKVAVVAVNDHHVMAAWAKATGGEGKIDFLADGSAKFVMALGLDNDQTEDGMGIRSRRFSMIVENGVVTTLNVEEVKGQVTNSGAAAILDQLSAAAAEA